MLLTAYLFVTHNTHNAYASSLESRAWLGAQVNITQAGTSREQAGPGTQFGFQLSFNDFFALYLGTDFSYQLDNKDAALKAAPVHDLFLGLLYSFDVVEWVPQLGLSMVYYTLPLPMPEGVPPPVLGAKLTLGLQWRAYRAWSFSGLIEMNAPFSNLDNYSIYTMIGANVAYHWRW